MRVSENNKCISAVFHFTDGTTRRAQMALFFSPVLYNSVCASDQCPLAQSSSLTVTQTPYFGNSAFENGVDDLAMRQQEGGDAIKDKMDAISGHLRQRTRARLWQRGRRVCQQQCWTNRHWFSITRKVDEPQTHIHTYSAAIFFCHCTNPCVVLSWCRCFFTAKTIDSARML